jgi:transketolase C-terminal domain/subunit
MNDRQLGDVAQNQFWKHLQAAMEQAGYSQQEVMSVAASVSRHGLLIPTSAFSAFVYITSPWLIELGELADLEELQSASKG